MPPAQAGCIRAGYCSPSASISRGTCVIACSRTTLCWRTACRGIPHATWSTARSVSRPRCKGLDQWQRFRAKVCHAHAYGREVLAFMHRSSVNHSHVCGGSRRSPHLLQGLNSAGGGKWHSIAEKDRMKLQINPGEPSFRRAHKTLAHCWCQWGHPSLALPKQHLMFFRDHDLLCRKREGGGE